MTDETLRLHIRETFSLKRISELGCLHRQGVALRFSLIISLNWFHGKLIMFSSIKIVSHTRAVFGGSQMFKASASQRVIKQGNFDWDQSNVTSTRRMSGKGFNVPPSAEFVARVSGIATMCKLPFQKTADGLDAAFVGVPIDTGTSNRPGARYCTSYSTHDHECHMPATIWHCVI